MSDQPKKSNFFEKLATFIVDKRNLIFFLYAIAIIASLITQSWVKVCDDLTQYLPETTETRRGLTLMEDEMKTYGTARIIVSHVTYEIARDLADQIEDLSLNRHIESRCRLIGDQNLRLTGESHRDHDSLAHTARHLMRILVSTNRRICNADCLHHANRLIHRFLLLHSAV